RNCHPGQHYLRYLGGVAQARHAIAGDDGERHDYERRRQDPARPAIAQPEEAVGGEREQQEVRDDSRLLDALLTPFRELDLAPWLPEVPDAQEADRRNDRQAAHVALGVVDPLLAPDHRLVRLFGLPPRRQASDVPASEV